MPHDDELGTSPRSGQSAPSTGALSGASDRPAISILAVAADPVVGDVATTVVATLADARRALLGTSYDAIVLSVDTPDIVPTDAVAVLGAAAPFAGIVVLASRDRDPAALAAVAQGAHSALVRDTVTAPRLVEVAMRARERALARRPEVTARLSSAIERLAAPTVALDGRGIILEANDAWRAADVFGDRPDARAAIGASYLELCRDLRVEAGDAGARIADGVRSVLAGETDHFSAEYAAAGGSGSVSWWAVRVTPLGQVGGGAIVSHLDITSVRAVEDEVRSTDDRVRLSGDTSLEVFVLLDPEGRVVDVASRTLDLFGLRREQVIGSSPARAVHPLDLDALLSALHDTAGQSGSRVAVEIDIRDATGRWRRLDLVLANLLDEPGVNAVVVTGRDATARRAAAVRSALHAQVLDRLPAAVAVTNTRGAVVYWNATAAELFGWSEDEVLGRAAADVIGPLPGPRSLPELLAQLGADRWEGDWDAPTASGASVPVYTTVSRLSLPDLGFEGFVTASIDATERRRLESELAFITLHDPLTGLPNRSLLVDRLDAALDRAGDELVAVLHFDLDQFGEVNDAAGRVGGDEVLKVVAERLRSGGPAEATTVARVEGDEFVVLVEHVTGVDDAVRATGRLQAALAGRVGADRGRVSVTASVGIAVGSPGDNPERVLRDAAAAMYRAKGHGAGGVEIYDPQLQAEARAHAALAAALRRAIEHEELVVHYQPLWSVADGSPVGAEALVRWARPGHGLVPPDGFVPFAESTGEIAAVDAYVLRAVCRDIASWAAAGRSLRVSVNVSARHLSDPEFPDLVSGVLAATRVDPASVCLEVTESAVMDDVDRSIASLRALKARGLRLAIDDFGTGYSSLAYLKRLPVDELKVDRSFVDGLGRDPEDTVIVSAVVTLGRTLGLDVVAEGVETPRQLQELRALGCTIAQGYLWSPAVDRDALAAVLDRRTGPAR